MHSVDVATWASAYIAAEELSSHEKADSPNWWAIERFMNPQERQQAEDAWLAILEVLARNPSQEVLGMLAAGPLEDLVEDWGPEFIERIELMSRQSPPFRHLLGGVWKSSTSEVWLRIEQARGKSW